MARQFNGTSDKGTLTAAISGVSTTGAFTVAAWVNADSTSAGPHVIFVSGTSPTYHCSLRRDGADWGAFLRTNTPGSDNATQFVGGVTAGQWTHVAMTYDGTSLKLYVNGVLKATTVVTGTGFNNGSANSLGENDVDGAGGAQFWDGRIAELAIWNSDIGATDIATLAAATINDAALNKSLIATQAVEYWNLLGLLSPEPCGTIDVNGNRIAHDWTLTGTSKLDSPIGKMFFVQGANATTPVSTHTSPLTVTIPSTVAGDDLLVMISNGDEPNPVATVTGITDGGVTFNFSFLGAITNVTTGKARAEAWAARNVPAGITSVVVTWTAGAVASVNVLEYFGVKAFGQVVKASGTAGTAATISLTTSDADNHVVAELGDESTAQSQFTASSAGAFRLRGYALGNGLPDVNGALLVGSSATPASVTCTIGTPATAQGWAAIAVELRSVPPQAAIDYLTDSGGMVGQLWR